MQKIEDQHAFSWTARLALVLALAIAPIATFSFQVLPKVSDVDRKLAGLGGNWVLDPLGQFAMNGMLPMVKNPVHEAITLSAVGCNPLPSEEKGCVVLGRSVYRKKSCNWSRCIWTANKSSAFCCEIIKTIVSN